MPSYKWDFNSCAIRDGFCKSSHISRVLEQEKALCQVLSVHRKTAHLVPTWQDLEMLESINKALTPLTDFTDILSGEKCVTFFNTGSSSETYNR